MNQSSKHQGRPPNKHLMAFLTFIALLPLVYFIPPFVMENISHDHVWVTVFSVAIIVPIVSYMALPLMLVIVDRLPKHIKYH